MTNFHPRTHLQKLGHNTLAQKLLFIEEKELLIYQDDRSKFIGHLKNLIVSNQSIPVLRLDHNPHPMNFYLNELAREIDPSDFLIFVWDASDQKSLPDNIVYWPTCFYDQRLSFDIESLKPRKGRVSFLSSTTRWHRIFLYKSLKNKFLSNQDVVVINKKSKKLYDNPYDVNHVYAKSTKHWLDELPWATNNQYFDQDQDQDWVDNLAAADHPAFQCRINITGESLSRGPHIFVTEKTWKPLRSGCLLMNYGCDLMPHYLKSLGFSLLDKDICATLEDKIKIIEQLLEQDIDKIYHDNLDIVNHNLTRFWSDDLFKTISRESVEKLYKFISY